MPRYSLIRSTREALARRASRREDRLHSRIVELEEELRAAREQIAKGKREEQVLGQNLEQLQDDNYLAREIFARRIRPLVVPDRLERCAEAAVDLIDLADAARERETRVGDRAIRELRACGHHGLSRNACVRLVCALQRMRRSKPSLHAG